MSGRDYNRQPLADDIFGRSVPTPEVGYNEATSVTEPVGLYPAYAPASSQPLGDGEPRFFAAVAGHKDKIFEYPDGRRVVRVQRKAAGSPPANELPKAVAETLSPAVVAPVNSRLRFELRKDTEGGLSGEFDVKGDFMGRLLEGLAGATATNPTPIAPVRQLESSSATQYAPQRVVVPTSVRPHEAPQSENDNDWPSHEAATIASHGLKKVIKAVLRPRLASAVLALSVAVAAGAYRLESGELPIHGNSIAAFQADYNQVIHHPLQTIAAKIGRL